MSRTTTKTRGDDRMAPVGEVKSAGALVVMEQSRLPYYDEVKELFGVDAFAWRNLIDAIWPSAKTIEGVMMALAYCRQRGLDPFKKQVHIVPMWSAALGREIETVWPGIAEIRTTAHRTKNYAGIDAVEQGPTETVVYEGRVKKWVENEDGRGRSEKMVNERVEITRPEWMRYTVYRMVEGTRCPFVGPKVYFDEAYAPASRWTPDLPNAMWSGRPEGQLDKCAEAAALRRAFPEELGNEYAAEEMAGKTLGIDLERDAKAAGRVSVVEGKAHEAPDPEEVEAKVAAHADSVNLNEDPDDDTADDADFEPVLVEAYRIAFEKVDNGGALKKLGEEVAADDDLTQADKDVCRQHYAAARQRLKAAAVAATGGAVKPASELPPREEEPPPASVIPGLNGSNEVVDEEAFVQWVKDLLASAETLGELNASWTNIVKPIRKDPALEADLQMLFQEERELRDDAQ